MSFEGPFALTADEQELISVLGVRAAIGPDNTGTLFKNTVRG